MKKKVVAIVTVILALALVAPAYAEALSVLQGLSRMHSADVEGYSCPGISGSSPVSSVRSLSLCQDCLHNDSLSLTTRSQGQHPGWLSPQTLLLICRQGLGGSSDTSGAPVVMAGLSMLPYPSEGTCPEQNEPLAGLLALLFMGCILMVIAGIIRKSTPIPAITLDGNDRMQDGYASERPFSAGRNVTPLKPSVSAGS